MWSTVVMARLINDVGPKRLPLFFGPAVRTLKKWHDVLLCALNQLPELCLRCLHEIPRMNECEQ